MVAVVVLFGTGMDFWAALLLGERVLVLPLVMVGRLMGMGDMLELGLGLEMVTGLVVDIRSRVGKETELAWKGLYLRLGIKCPLWRVQCT
jgi:hypothetical protein